MLATAINVHFLKRSLPYIILCILMASCTTQAPQPSSLFKSHPLGFVNQLQTTPQLNILNYLYFYNGAGTALADFNNDGLLDIYLVGNQVQDELFLNNGNLNFKNITATALPPTNNSWSTGVTTVDINHDGLMDIYVSTVSNHLDLQSKNRLLINQGIHYGQLTFKEMGAAYGLDLSGLFTQAAFFDYDLDGDLDVYLLKHSVYPNSNYARGSVRNQQDSIHGDLLLENSDGIFVDVSAKATILQNKISYGLGLAVGDLNADGYPDIYVGNDFYENDYVYINQKDGTFLEVNSTENLLGHSTHFSMGNTLEDVNNDGHLDIFSVDMLPQNLETLKASGTEFSYPIYQNQLKNGYQPQFMQNTLHFNLGQQVFSETAFASGVAASEWSWAPLIADFNNDGRKDIIITNGILGATNDMDFINFISNDNIQKKLGSGMSPEDLALITKLPKKKTANKAYQNATGTTFTEVSTQWLGTETSYSNGAAYGDLDNDGDLDIVINNVNEPAQILENKTANEDSRYLHIHFKGSPKNRFGIGAQVTVYTQKNKQYYENYTTKGYLSSVPPYVSIGLEQGVAIDSLLVVWPDARFQKIIAPSATGKLTLEHNSALGKHNLEYWNTKKLDWVQTAPPIDFKHKDAPTLEFNRDPLVPYASTNLGKTLVVGQLDENTLDDVVTLGGKGQESRLLVQQEDGTFETNDLPDGKETAIHEDVAAVVFDANQDGATDLLIVSGGNEFNTGAPLAPRLYLKQANQWVRDTVQFKGLAINASSVTAVDFDLDRDLDIVITSNLSPRIFGQTPAQFIFENDGQGHFKEVTVTLAPDFQYLGNVQSVEWADINADGYPDAIAVGHWLAPTLLINKQGAAFDVLQLPDEYNGWWNTLKIHDFDQDGDLDFIAGNWGLNTRLSASLEQPLTLYNADFDDNGKMDPIITYFYNDIETTLASKDELAKQLPFINKNYLSYNAFAKASVREIFSESKLEKATKKTVSTLATTYFENQGNTSFVAHNLPFFSQVSTVNDIQLDDYNKDGFIDAFVVGNTFEISTQLGRLDGSHGLLLLNDQKGFFTAQNIPSAGLKGPMRGIHSITIADTLYRIIGRNNDAPLFIKKNTLND